MQKVKLHEFMHAENIVCDLTICRCNIDWLCKAEEPWQCPKNNSQSIYENAELLKFKLDKEYKDT